MSVGIVDVDITLKRNSLINYNFNPYKILITFFYFTHIKSVSKTRQLNKRKLCYFLISQIINFTTNSIPQPIKYFQKF